MTTTWLLQLTLTTRSWSPDRRIRRWQSGTWARSTGWTSSMVTTVVSQEFRFGINSSLLKQVTLNINNLLFKHSYCFVSLTPNSIYIMPTSIFTNEWQHIDAFSQYPKNDTSNTFPQQTIVFTLCQHHSSVFTKPFCFLTLIFVSARRKKMIVSKIFCLAKPRLSFVSGKCLPGFKRENVKISSNSNSNCGVASLNDFNLP